MKKTIIGLPIIVLLVVGIIGCSSAPNLTSIVEISNYLDNAKGGESVEKPVKLKVSFPLDQNESWESLLKILDNAKKYVDLDLSGCTMSGTEFDPDYFIEIGKEYIVSMVLPISAKSIISGNGDILESDDSISLMFALGMFDVLFGDSDIDDVSSIFDKYFSSGDGDKITFPRFAYFDNLKSVSGSQITHINDYVFKGLKNIESVNFPLATHIGEAAFASCENLSTITIPAVTTIGERAFYGCTAISKLNVPLVTHIGDRAFQGCEWLTTVNLPAATSIGRYAFMGCRGIKSVSFPVVVSFGSMAFSGCTSLTSITIPASVTSYESGVFDSCTSLKEIKTASLNQSYSSVDGILYNKIQNVIVQYPAGRTGSFTIPSGVTRIEENSFCGSQLSSVTIPNGVTIIVDDAFRDSQISQINIPEGITEIGDRAFRRCVNLVSISLPASLRRIGENIFDGCLMLDSVEVAEANRLYSSLDGVLYNKAKTTIVRYPSGRSGSYIIPDGVTSIGIGAFSSSEKLTEIDAPNSLTHIGVRAFYGCSSLTSANFPRVTNVENYAFYQCSSLTTIQLPRVSEIGDYVFGATSSTELSITMGSTSPKVGERLFSLIDEPKSVTVRIPPNASNYGSTPTDTTTENWGNGFRGKGVSITQYDAGPNHIWTTTRTRYRTESKYGDGTVNSYIDLKIVRD